jgi:hypothetical protein
MALVECAECGKRISDRAETCPKCGASNDRKDCPECGTSVSMGTGCCPECGYPLEEPERKSTRKRRSESPGKSTGSTEHFVRARDDRDWNTLLPMLKSDPGLLHLIDGHILRAATHDYRKGTEKGLRSHKNLKTLLAAGADPNILVGDKRTLLYDLECSHYFARLSMRGKGALPGSSNPAAALEFLTTSARLLIDAGLDLVAPCRERPYPNAFVSMHEFWPDLFDLILATGFDVKAKFRTDDGMRDTFEFLLYSTALNWNDTLGLRTPERKGALKRMVAVYTKHNKLTFGQKLKLKGF